MGFNDMHVQLVLTSLWQTAITKLVLDENRITDMGAKFIEQSLLFTHLDFLDISYNQISQQGIDLLETSSRASTGIRVKWWQS